MHVASFRYIPIQHSGLLYKYIHADVIEGTEGFYIEVMHAASFRYQSSILGWQICYRHADIIDRSKGRALVYSRQRCTVWCLASEASPASDSMRDNVC